jgi:hypothetical protein
MVEAWKVLDDAGVDKALRSNSEKITKAHDYLKNNPTKKETFLNDLKTTANPEKFIDRTSWKDELIQKYGDDINQFKPQGLSKSDVPEAVYQEMLKASSAPLDLKEDIVNSFIKSGSSVPVQESFKAGDALFKIVPKGDGVTDFSPFWLKKSEIDKLKKVGNVEENLGLPLKSHAVEYDVYKITAKQSGDVFNSTIAPTIQNGYKTIGGAQQSLVLDRGIWSSAVKIETFIP